MIFNHLQWFYRIALMVSKVKPGSQIIIILSGFFSRIASMLSLLLPVKILLLLGNDRVPRYFPSFLLEIPQDTLVISLCVATIMLYIFHIVLEKIITLLSSKVESVFISQLISQTSKGGVVKLINKTYKKVSDNLTELVFIIAVSIFIIFSYPSLFILLCIYTVIVLAVYEFLSLGEDDNNIEADDEQESQGTLINLWIDIGFLGSFLFVVLGMLIGQRGDFIVAFICFLLLRRSSGSINRFIKNLIKLYDWKSRLSPLLSEKVECQLSNEKDVKLSTSKYHLMIAIILQETFPNKIVNVVSEKSFDQEDESLLAYIVEANVSGQKRSFIIRLFAQNTQRAKDEYQLYSSILTPSSNAVINYGKDEKMGWLVVSF